MASLGQVQEGLVPSGRPLLVNHWATWCEGCVEELGLLARLRSKTRGKLDFLGVGWEAFLGDPTPARLVETIEATETRFGMDWPTLIFDGEPDELFEGLELKNRQIPQTFLYDSDGRLLAHFPGELDESALGQIETLLEKSSKESADAR